ncbi:MAG: glycosyltransferase family 2 protein [Roseovarius sp.]|uniref:glycosyltransferase family 2 protein n=1 Tax=Roseovarius sp. TaxID=1486281 RepID=UPI001B590C77|nr:glycosyltransferase family 2 protein [Roseovarius sp.]MBQ0751329.1 glycosyltransferase family 2 protein [Roseovarius sp.]MBQ0808697.1 glycosyltransferase family 2 protein [Roseovarius sp.]
MSAQVIERRMAGQMLDGIVLLDAVETRQDDGTRHVTLFFAPKVDPALIVPPKGAELRAEMSVGGAPILVYSAPEGRLAFQTPTGAMEVTPAEAELSLMEGRDTIAAVRNGEDAATVLTWLAFHADQQRMTGAVILDRARPGTDPEFARALREALRESGLEIPVILLSSDQPLGYPDAPPEAHPFCVPEAPGKDRMEIPPPAPWDSPLGALSYYEIARHRFLAEARAVANIDVHDLVVTGSETIFDSAVAARGGLIALIGRHCYPWRVRNGQPTRFADHICVQFDSGGGRQRWCLAPSKLPKDAVWRLLRVGNARPDAERTQGFYRHMALRHPTESISRIVPKSSLIEHPPLLERAAAYFDHTPVRMPEIAPDPALGGRGRAAIVTTMKNEGPFILEWLAYHRAIGFDDILVYTNDCTDGTDTMLQLLERKGFVQHRDNRFREMDMPPQHAALQSAEHEPLIKSATWITCIDVDEYINIKTGDGTLDALFAAVPDANMIAMTWRLFGNGDVRDYVDRPITEQFLRCAPEFARKPHQAWGFKTLFQNIGLFKKLGVHRPKGLNPQLWEEINWVNGSGTPLPREMYRNGWRSTIETYGYDLVQLNHYAVRSAESFLVKRDRGRVNHVDRDQGLAYWFRMNNNFEEELSIQPRLAMMRAELDRLMQDPEIAAAHHHSVACHRAKIDELRATENYSNFFAELTSPRMERLSRLHGHFGSNVFLSGPGVIPDEIVSRDPAAEWFFTVDLQGDTAH